MQMLCSASRLFQNQTTRRAHSRSPAHACQSLRYRGCCSLLGLILILFGTILRSIFPLLSSTKRGQTKRRFINSDAKLPLMPLVVILIILVVLFGGGGYYMGPGSDITVAVVLASFLH
jgi:hypothetical protein